jgi:hypothetical protein
MTHQKWLSLVMAKAKELPAVAPTSFALRVSNWLPQEENAGLSLASDTEAYAGHLARARELTKRSIDSALRVDSKETGAIWHEIAAQREAAFGNTLDAKQEATRGLPLYPASQGVEAEAALALALARMI